MNDGIPSPSTQKQLECRMASAGIREHDLVERFIRGSGPGGQKINKTSSCVYIRHIPSGIDVKCQRGRSQAMNRFLARREICERIERHVLGLQTAKQQEAERIRRQKRRRSRRQRAKMMEDKHMHARIKTWRRPVDTIHDT